MNLYKTDLKKIGGTCSKNEQNNLIIISDIVLSNIEEILLREILLLFGDYRILESNDFKWDNGDICIEFVTNLPYEIYNNL